MFRRTILFVSLSLFWLPSSPANPAALRTGLRRVAGISLIAGASYLGLTQDGRKTRATVWDAAEKILATISETAEQNKEYLATLFGEQKDEHTVMLKTLVKLEKQNNVLKRQNALILNKVYDLETMVAQVNQYMQGQPITIDETLSQQPNFLTAENEANEHPLTRRGVIVMETED